MSTLPIRICTIDTPETAKFGKKGQPFGEEAKEALSDMVFDRKVRVRLLQRDQYGRAVAQVDQPVAWWRKFFQWVLVAFRGSTTCVDEVLLRKGLAEVYQGSGAVYGPLGKERYMEIQDEAKQQKIGIWSLKNRESAAEYKRRNK